jgi:hypothetical protein
MGRGVRLANSRRYAASIRNNDPVLASPAPDRLELGVLDRKSATPARLTNRNLGSPRGAHVRVKEIAQSLRVRIRQIDLERLTLESEEHGAPGIRFDYGLVQIINELNSDFLHITRISA